MWLGLPTYICDDRRRYRQIIGLFTRKWVDVLVAPGSTRIDLA